MNGTPKGAAVSYRFGVPLDSTLERRERFADLYDYDFGRDRVFPELIDALLDELPEGRSILEVGAATGLLTKPLLGKAARLTAMEPSLGMLNRLLSSEVSGSDKLGTILGLVEDLPHDSYFDHAVVTFTPRRGVGLLHLLTELAGHVHDSVVMLLDEDGTLDWAYLARAAAAQGFDVRMHIVSSGESACDERRTAVLLTVNVKEWCPSPPVSDAWEFEARVVEVPFPAPRGAATRLVRYFLAGGDRALVVRTEDTGVDRLYGNLRTAAHRLARDEVTVRRVDDGVQLVKLPRAAE